MVKVEPIIVKGFSSVTSPTAPKDAPGSQNQESAHGREGGRHGETRATGKMGIEVKA